MNNRLLEILSEEGAGGVLRRLSYRFYFAKLAIAKLIRLSAVRSRYGVLLAANYSDSTYKYYVAGTYGDYYWNRLTDINSDFVFLDIGANQGLYTLCAALNPNNIQSYAFEPVPETYRLLVKNIELNKIDHKCVAVQKAVSDTTSIAKIKIKNNHSGAASLANQNSINAEGKEVEISTIDGGDLASAVDDRNLPIFVKIDVEGFERTVIEQLVCSGLSERISEIYYEVDERWLNPIELENILRTAGFKKFQKLRKGRHYDVLATKS